VVLAELGQQLAVLAVPYYNGAEKQSGSIAAAACETLLYNLPDELPIDKRRRLKHIFEQLLVNLDGN